MKLNLNKLSVEMYGIAKMREENGAKISTEIMPMLKHCATEVVEATEALVKMENTPCDNSEIDKLYHDFELELGDIICCALIIAGREEIDITKVLCEVVEKNKKRAMKTGDKL